MSKKIFELAKELDKSPLDLVEELKSNGFPVRNHMAVLSDEDVAKAMLLFAPKEEPKKKKAKKKASVRKKKTVKKVAKKASSDAPVADKSETEAKPKVAKKASSNTTADADEKKTSIRKKTVVRKKGTEKEELKISLDGENQFIEDRPSGLRIIAHPDAPAAAPVDETSAPEEKSLFTEKVHRFTPVFIPEKKPEEENKKPADAQGSTTTTTGEAGTTAATAESGTKKRMGGLASMMSGKKAVVNKSQVLTQDRADSEMRSYAALNTTGRPLYSQVKRKRIFSGASSSTEVTEVKDSKRVVRIGNGALVEELAKKLKIKLKDMIDQALDMNLLIKNGDFVGMILASEIAALYGYRVENSAFDEEAFIGDGDITEEEKNKYPVRNPIITIMGHVDHGKTTLLDYIRHAKVADGEAGGITQHIGAYSVDVNGKTLTFLDTPGHAAFASMRQRGADVTDLVVLVVAADDGVMPQTRESIKYCEAAGVPIIVAVNKMDKEGANPDRIKSELADHNLTPEDWGGETQFVHLSAINGEGVEQLLEGIALQAEMMELRADPAGKAEGTVIESKVEQGRGAVATIIIQKGTLKKGQSLVVGETFGRARNLIDPYGKEVSEAGPSTPVQVLGLDQAPSPGDILNIVKNDREGKKVAQNRITLRKSLENTKVPKKMTLEDFFAQSSTDGKEQKTLNLIIRSDVQGSFEAIKQSLEALGNSEVAVKLISGGVGAINENDVQLADSTMAIIVGFNMRPISTARRLAEQKGIEIKTYSIIYELIDDVKLAIEGMLEPDFIEEFLGRAEVKETFSVPKIGVIAGSSVIDGRITDSCNVRLLREGKIIFDGKLSSLKRFKDNVKEVKNGFECGVGLEDYNDIKVNDIFEAYQMNEKKRNLEDVAAKEAADEAEAAKIAEAAAAAAAEEAASEVVQ